MLARNSMKNSEKWLNPLSILSGEAQSVAFLILFAINLAKKTNFYEVVVQRAQRSEAAIKI
jgi:hypothetical protein